MMRKFNIEDLVKVIEVLYNSSMSAVLLDNQIGYIYQYSSCTSRAFPINGAVQHLFGEHPVQNPPSPPNINLHW